MVSKKNKTAIVLLSGGLDSSCLAYLAAKENKEVYTLSFDYGQRHKKELISSSKISKKIKAKKHFICKFDLGLWGGSALTDKKISVPYNKNITNMSSKHKTLESEIPITYVPARNTIFLSFGLSLAETVHADSIYIGVNAVDYSGYVDCRKEFIDRFQKLSDYATVQGVYGKPIEIKTPLLNLSKKEIILLGEKLNVDWALTWSCYRGGKVACGKCDSCLLRLKGFKDAGIIDLAKYNF